MRTVTWKKERGTRNHLQFFVPLFAIASNQVSTPAEIRCWAASLTYSFPFRLDPHQTTETNVSRAIYSALTAMCHQSSHSQVTTSLGIKADIFSFFGIHLTVNLLSIWWGSFKHCKQLVRRMRSSLSSHSRELHHLQH